MHILQGKLVAERILNDARERIARFGVAPVFAAVLVGNDPASHMYVDLKEKAAQSIGIEFRKILLPKETSQATLLETIARLNQDVSVHGILVQLPLPEHIDTQTIIDAIDPKKDADGFHPENARRFVAGEQGIAPVFPRAIVELIRATNKTLSGLQAVIVTNSDVFGNMMIAALARENVRGSFILRENFEAERGKLLGADIVVTACGVPGLIVGSDVKRGAIVIDGGVSKVEGRVCGDVARTSFDSQEGWLSPVPGGVGPVTIACLLDTVTRIACDDFAA